MNKVIQTLRLVNDPELKTYGEDKKLVSFRGAVKKRFKKSNDEPDNFFNYTAYGKTAEFIAKYFKKGQMMIIEGEINNNNYEKDGVKHYTNQIVIDTVEFSGSKSDGEVTPRDTSSTSAKETTTNSSKSKEVESYDEFDDF